MTSHLSMCGVRPLVTGLTFIVKGIANPWKGCCHLYKRRKIQSFPVSYDQVLSDFVSSRQVYVTELALRCHFSVSN